MTLYDPSRRYRRRLWGALIRFAFYVGTLLVAVVFAFQVGVERNKQREEQLLAELEELEQSHDILQEANIRLEAARQTAETEYRRLLGRYEREVPQGVERELAEIVSAKLEAGAAPDRLAFVIQSADRPRDCSEAETKRFIMPTPIYQGPNTAVGFADGRITVSGLGESARNAAGGPEGWFDPAEPVTVRFTRIGGEQEEISGELPLHHSIALGDAEYRFTIVPGNRSFVQVTADRCPLPQQQAEAGAAGQ